MSLEGSGSAYMIEEATGRVLLLCEACRRRPGLVPRKWETLHITHNPLRRMSRDVSQPVLLVSSAPATREEVASAAAPSAPKKVTLPPRIPRRRGPDHEAIFQKGLPNLMRLSVSQDVRTAMGEWEWSGEDIDSSDVRFPEACEFCHAKIQRAFRVVNHRNQNEAWLGSTCVVRYAHSGVGSEEEARTKFNRARKKKQQLEAIHRLVALMLSNPKHQLSGDDFELLHKCVHGYFDVHNTRDLEEGRWYHAYMSEIVQAPWSEFADAPETAADARLVLRILFNPDGMIRQGPREKPKDWKQYIGGRRAKVRTTISRGEHTRPPGY